MKLTPKNWNTFQHYKDRAPAWIKLHKGLLDDFQFASLPVASRALAPCLWLLASEYEGGEITATLDEIAFRLRMSRGELSEAIHPLIESKFFTIDSDLLAEPEQLAIPEKEKEKEKEREIQEEKEEDISAVAIATCATDWPTDYREIFWAEYPRKVGKKGALRELERIRKSTPCPYFERLISAVRAYAATADPQFTKHPKTWLNNGCWDDEPDTRKPHGPTAPNGLAQALDKLKQHVGEVDRSEEGGRPPSRLLSFG
jgi:hypothetical protein